MYTATQLHTMIDLHRDVLHSSHKGNGTPVISTMLQSNTMPEHHKSHDNTNLVTSQQVQTLLMF